MAKRDRDKKLTQRQELVVRELGKGKGIAAAARAVGVSRRTVYNWLGEPGFVAAMNRWRESVVTLVRGKVLAGLGDAAATVVNAAREGDARIALALLDRSRIFDPPSHTSTDPDRIAREQLLRERTDRVGLDSVEWAVADTEKLNDHRRALATLSSATRPPKTIAAPAQAESGGNGENEGQAAKEGQGGQGGQGGQEQVKGSYENLLQALGLPPGLGKETADHPTPAETHKPDPEVEAAVAAADAFVAAEAAKISERHNAQEHDEHPPTSAANDPLAPNSEPPVTEPPSIPPSPPRAPAIPLAPRRKPPPPPVAWSNDEYP